MGLSCRFSMLRLGLPPLQSPFPNNSSPISIRAREAYFESVRFSFLTTSTEEKEILYPDSLRAHTCMSPAPQIIGNDYSEIEMISNARSHKGLHNMMNYTQESMEKDSSMLLPTLQVCKVSHFRLLMENISTLEDRIADSNLVELERDILVQLGRLGARDLFQDCLSGTLTHPIASEISDTLTDCTGNDQTEEIVDGDAGKIVVRSGKKEERKFKREYQTNKQSSERFLQSLLQFPVSSARKKLKSKSKWAKISKNEAEMSNAIKIVANLERIKATLEKASGHTISLSSWAEAAGIDEKLLRHRLHFGWHCRDELLRSARSLVLYLARNYRGLGVASEDLLQAGNIGVLQGAERFDHTRGYKFSTYVQYWIKKAMSALVSRHAKGIKIPLSLSTAINRIQKARQDLHKNHGKYLDDIEIAKFTGLSLDKIQSARNIIRVVGSTDRTIGDWSCIKFLECMPDKSVEISERIFMRKQMKDDISKLLESLDPKERQVLVLRYGFGGHQCKSLDEIGKHFRLSKEWIRRTEKRALRKLRAESNQISLSHYLNLY